MNGGRAPGRVNLNRRLCEVMQLTGRCRWLADVIIPLGGSSSAFSSPARWRSCGVRNAARLAVSRRTHFSADLYHQQHLPPVDR
ncbi:MAG: hypothetical protein ACLTXH_03880 [Enterobacter hormaechei]